MLTLSQWNRSLAHAGVDRAPDGYVMELREAKRSDPQNAALWGALNQIQKQRPSHNGVKMTPDLWKVVFMDALGSEMAMMPKLAGDGYFPTGHSSSKLTKAEFANLLTVILAWAAREGLTIDHFDDGEGAGGVSSPVRTAA